MSLDGGESRAKSVTKGEDEPEPVPKDMSTTLKSAREEERRKGKAVSRQLVSECVDGCGWMGWLESMAGGPIGLSPPRGCRRKSCRALGLQRWRSMCGGFEAGASTVGAYDDWHAEIISGRPNLDGGAVIRQRLAPAG